MNMQEERAKRKLREKVEKKDRLRGYTLMDFESYYGALRNLYSHVLLNGYDAILIPLRGAEPFMKAIRLFASLERKSNRLPHVVYLKIGERVSEPPEGLPLRSLPEHFGAKLPAHNLASQKETIKNELARLSVKTGKTKLKLLLIDEVILGGSVLKQQNLITAAGTELGIAIKLKTAVLSELGQVKTPQFRALVRSGVIQVFGVRKLISSDNFKFLLQLVNTRQGERVLLSRHAAEHRMELMGRLQTRFKRK